MGKNVLGPNHNDPLTIATIIQISTPNHGIAAKSNIVTPVISTNASNFMSNSAIRQIHALDIAEYQSHTSHEFTL
jgi:hypothetical protein